MLTIKILFTINSLKKTIPSKHYLQFLLIKKNPLNFDNKKIHLIKKIIRIKIISFQLKQSLSIQKTIFKVKRILTKKITKKGN